MIDTNLMKFPEEKVQKLMSHYKEILSLLGEDPEREGLLKTPERVAKAIADFNSLVMKLTLKRC